MLFNPKTTLFDMLLPRRCLVCKTDIVQGIICECCNSLCNPCPNPHISLKAGHHGALFYYEFTIKEIIKRAKFEKNVALTHLLLTLVERELLKSDLLPQIQKFSPCAITFVPAHWAKRLTHSIHLPLLFAQILSRTVQVPVVNILVKNKYNFTQSTLLKKSQRIIEVKGLFSPISDLKIYNKLILVDDIVTSGATFDEIGKIVHNLGSKLRCVAMAKTP